MLRLLALSLLALAAPQAAAQQVHPCQAQTPPCSLAMAQARHYLDELDSKAGNFVAPPDAPSVSPELAQARRDTEKTSRHVDELWREYGPGTPAWEQANYYNKYKTTAPPEPRRYVPYPLSRELLTGAVDPCDSAYASCPPELERIYNGLSRARHRDDQSLLKMYQRSLRYYYRTYQP